VGQELFSIKVAVEAATEALVADTWEKPGPAPEVDYDQV
jgi:hypothetical protein